MGACGALDKPGLVPLNPTPGPVPAASTHGRARGPVRAFLDRTLPTVTMTDALDRQARTTAGLSLESTSGERVALSSLRGRAVVIFYEERAHTADNDELRQLLARCSLERAPADRLAVLHVANVSSYDFRPARDIARAAVRAVARRVNAEILLDWAGALQAPPFSLVRGASNVVLVDRAGRVAWKHAGPVEGPVRAELFRALEAVLEDR